MATRKIIEITEELCDGCGQCVTGCAEGALRIVDGKAKLVADIYCDGLGACLGHCPTGALKIIEREAVAFDEEAVEAMLAEQTVARPHTAPPAMMGACPSGTVHQMTPCQQANLPGLQSDRQSDSALGHWPVQLRLVSPNAPFLRGADILLLADCAALAVPDLHQRYVADQVVLMGCPKFDDTAFYVERLRDILAQNKVRTLTALEMEVPCCSGLSRIAARAVSLAKSATPLTRVMVARDGRELEREELENSKGALAL